MLRSFFIHNLLYIRCIFGCVAHTRVQTNRTSHTVYTSLCRAFQNIQSLGKYTNQFSDKIFRPIFSGDHIAQHYLIAYDVHDVRHDSCVNFSSKFPWNKMCASYVLYGITHVIFANIYSKHTCVSACFIHKHKLNRIAQHIQHCFCCCC